MSKEEKAASIINWRHRWLGALFLFTHIEYQKGLWLDHKYPNEIGFYQEDICKYFDDLYLDDHYEYHLKEGNITLKEFLAIKDFHFKLDAYAEMSNRPGSKFKADQIFEDEAWLEICALGRLSWNTLKGIIIDPDELAHMNGLEMNYLK